MEAVTSQKGLHHSSTKEDTSEAAPFSYLPFNPPISYRFCCGLRTPNGYCVSFELLLGQYETYSRHRNPSPFALQALDLLKKAQQQDKRLQEKLTTVFKTIPEESKKEFLSRFSTELASDRARSTESAATIEGAPVDQLPQKFEDVAFILHKHIEKRIEARTILIEDLKKKLPETQSK